MSSTLSIHSLGKIGGFVRRLHYVEFLIRSIPALCLAFLTYVTFKDYLW